MQERVKIYRALPSIVTHLQDRMRKQRKEEKEKVEEYTTEYCEWRRGLKKQQKQIEEQEVRRYGQQAFTEFLRLSDKAGSEGPRYRQLYSNQASSKRSFYCPVKHAKQVKEFKHRNVVGSLPRTGLRRTLGTAEVIYHDNMKSRREQNPVAAFQASMRSELWSLLEIEQFLKSYLVHGKDFYRIASSLKSKQLPQVIKFYYLFKQKLKLKLHAMEFHSLENASSKQKLNLLEEIVARIKSQLDPSFLDKDRLNFLREHLRFSANEVNTFSLQDLIHMLRCAGNK